IDEASDAVRLLGVVPHASMSKLFHAADFAVVPSIWNEPFGMVALDAAAAGLPVIASRAGGLAEIVVDGQTGILVPPGDERELATAIMRLAAQPALRQELGTAARRRSLQFTWDRASDRIHRIYVDAFARKGLRPKLFTGSH